MKKVITILLILIIAVLLISPTVAVEPDNDYMSQMMATAVVGDADCGRQLAEARNTKIDEQGLTYSKVAWDDLYLLSKIIYAEAGSYWLSDEWKMSVGEVVLNRVASPEFPNTIRDVIYQKGQYYGSNSAWFGTTRPDARCVDAARRLLEGERIICDPSVVFQANFKQGGGTHTALYDKQLGWTYFCYTSKPGLYGEG